MGANELALINRGLAATGVDTLYLSFIVLLVYRLSSARVRVGVALLLLMLEVVERFEIDFGTTSGSFDKLNYAVRIQMVLAVFASSKG